MPIPVVCAKCGYNIQAPNHVAGRTLRCFKCLTPFTVPNVAAAPVAQFAPAPVAVFPDSPAAAPGPVPIGPAAVPVPFPAAPKAPPEPEAAPEFELDPLLAADNPAPSGEFEEIMPLEEVEELEVLEEEPPADGK
jgi:hypothetical protein